MSDANERDENVAADAGGLASDEAEGGDLEEVVVEYEPGQGIAPHIDRDCFGPVVATVSLGSAVNMDFCCDATGDETRSEAGR